ncbi:hypothetical protein [Microbacterium sp.]|uniref:hypothetical protein n=1 Tax=Microbacterium sp. TaxID=51671 RepID=UPI0039E6EF83
MVNKYGPNSEQLQRFVDAAQALTAEHVAPIAAITREPAVRDATRRVIRVKRSAARHSAIDSAARRLVSTVLKSVPPAETAAERMTRVEFGSLLEVSVFAVAARPELDDDTIGLIVDPIAEPLGFEWRSWGVGSTTASDATRD